MEQKTKNIIKLSKFILIIAGILIIGNIFIKKTQSAVEPPLIEITSFKINGTTVSSIQYYTGSQPASITATAIPVSSPSPVDLSWSAVGKIAKCTLSVFSGNKTTNIDVPPSGFFREYVHQTTNFDLKCVSGFSSSDFGAIGYAKVNIPTSSESQAIENEYQRLQGPVSILNFKADRYSSIYGEIILYEPKTVNFTWDTAGSLDFCTLDNNTKFESYIVTGPGLKSLFIDDKKVDSTGKAVFELNCRGTDGTSSKKTMKIKLNQSLAFKKTGTGLGSVRLSPAGFDCGSGGCAFSNIILESSSQTAVPFQPIGGTGIYVPPPSSGTSSPTSPSGGGGTSSPSQPSGGGSSALSGWKMATKSVSAQSPTRDCASNCNTSFPISSPVTLTATPETGSTFTGWGGDCSSFGTALTCTTTMNSIKTVTANFTAVNYSLSVAKTGSGTIASASVPSQTNINCGTSCNLNYSQGTTIALTALPATGSVFSGWGGACSGSLTTCSITMDAVKSVTANFSVITTTPPPTEPPVETLNCVTPPNEWKIPLSTAPNKNTCPPVNVGKVDQVKNSGIATDNIIVFGSSLVRGKVGVGKTTPPTVELDVDGTALILGKVNLTSLKSSSEKFLCINTVGEIVICP